VEFLALTELAEQDKPGCRYASGWPRTACHKAQRKEKGYSIETQRVCIANVIYLFTIYKQLKKKLKCTVQRKKEKEKEEEE